MLQRKVPQTLVYGVKQALARSQQQTKSAADGSDLIAVKDHVQSTASNSNNIIINNNSNNNNSNISTESAIQKFVSECSSGIQLSSSFSVDAVSNVSDAIIKSLGVEKLIEIAASTIELPKQESIAYYGSLDFSQEEFKMFISAQQEQQHINESSMNNRGNYTRSSKNLKMDSLSLATTTKAPLSNGNKNNKNNIDDNNDVTNIVSSKDSSVKFEELTSSIDNANSLSSLFDRILLGIKSMSSKLLQLLFGKQSSSNDSSSSSSSSSDSYVTHSLKNNEGTIKELSALGVIFAAAFAVDVLLVRMFSKAPMLSQVFRNSFRESLLKQFHF